MKNRILFALLSSCILLACQPKGSSQEAPNPNTTTQEQPSPKEEAKDPFASTSSNQEWQTLYNTTNSQVQAVYLPEAIHIGPDLSIVTGFDNIATRYQAIKENHSTVNEVFTQFYTEVRESISYEIAGFTTNDGVNFRQLVIWRTKDGRLLRELEFVAEASTLELDQAGIDAARNLWMERCNQNDANLLVSQSYTPNAFYYNHKPMVIGTEAISKEYAYMNREEYKLTLTPLKIEPVTESLAFEIGQCSGSYGGKYMIVWQKGKDDNWRVLFDSNV